MNPKRFNFKKVIAVLSCIALLFSLVPLGILTSAEGEDIPGLFAEYFRTSAYRAEPMPMELFNFNDKSGEGVMSSLDGRSLTDIINSYNGSPDYATAKFSGKLKVPQNGTYTFYGVGDDGFRIWIDGNLVIDFWEPRWEVPQTSAPISLTQGDHDFKVEYLQGWGGASLKIEWSSSSISRQIISAANFYHKSPEEMGLAGIRAQYYKFKAIDHISAYRFDTETYDGITANVNESDLKNIFATHNGDSGEYAGAIYYGYVVPKVDGNYTFTMSGNDAYRMWFNDQPVIDSWKLDSTGEKTSESYNLKANHLYKIKINYAQASGDANIKLSWALNGGLNEVIPTECLRPATVKDYAETQVVHGLLGEVYNGSLFEEETGTRIIPNVTRDYSWAGLFRDFNGSDQYASLRLTGQIEVDETKDYTFYLIGDDGFKMWINGKEVIEFWRAEWDKEQTSAPVTLNKGMNDIKIEYFQGYGGLYLDLKWSASGISKQNLPQECLYPAEKNLGVIGEYYKCEAGSVPADYGFTNKTGEGLSSQINFDNTALSDIFTQSNGNNENATARWISGIKTTNTDDYTFTMSGNDGYRVYLDGEKIIDNWVFSETATERTSDTVELNVTKRHTIMVELLQKTGNTEAKLYWQRNGGPKELVPASAFYISDNVQYEKLKAKDALLEEIIKADKLFNDTAVGTEIGQAPQTAKDEFLAAINHAKNIWKNTDSSSQEQKDEIVVLAEAAAKFRFLTVQSSEGKELTEFNNALYQGQDPYISYHDGYYYFVSTSNDPDHRRIYVSKSKSLIDQGERVQIFDFQNVQNRIFAPEIYFIKGKWYVYLCADVEINGFGGKHQGIVLESVTDDAQGEWIDRGILYTGANGVYGQANDFTIFEYDNELYASWGAMGEPEKPDQTPYGPAIVKMDSPIKISNDRVFLPGYGGEGPRPIIKDGKIFMTVSQGNFKSSGYHLAMYSYDPADGDILDENSWTYKDYVFYGTKDVYGPARAGFVKSADGTEDWMVFHSKVYPTNNNAWRQVGIKPIKWNEDGTPDFGAPISPYEFIDLPSGDPGLGLAYQAETAVTLGAAVKDYKNQGFQGTGYVNIPATNNSGVQFTVNVPAAGDYLVRARYANGVKNGNEWQAEIPDIVPVRGTLGLYVNGTRAKTTSFDKTETDWNHWMTSCDRVTLNAGENIITFRKDSSDSGNIYIDYIAVDEAHAKPTVVTQRSYSELTSLVSAAEAITRDEVPDNDLWDALKYAITAAKRLNSSSRAAAITSRFISLNAAIKDLEPEEKEDISTDENYNIYVTAEPEDGSKYNPVFYVKNLNNESKAVTLILASYDENGILAEVKIITKTISASEETELTNEISKETGLTYKFFIWEDNVKPLTEITSF